MFTYVPDTYMYSVPLCVRRHAWKPSVVVFTHEENVLEQSIYFFPVQKQIFYFTSSEKQLLLALFLRTFVWATPFAVSFDDNVGNTVGSLVM